MMCRVNGVGLKITDGKAPSKSCKNFNRSFVNFQFVYKTFFLISYLCNFLAVSGIRTAIMRASWLVVGESEFFTKKSFFFLRHRPVVRG